jgi:hypothetical protein
MSAPGPIQLQNDGDPFSQPLFICQGFQVADMTQVENMFNIDVRSRQCHAKSLRVSTNTKVGVINFAVVIFLDTNGSDLKESLWTL